MKKLILRIFTAIKFISGHLFAPGRHSYYPDKSRKSCFMIWLENIRWILVHHEINHYYYMYGFDRTDGPNQRDFFGKQEFNKVRNRANRFLTVNGRQTSYLCLLRDKFLFHQYLMTLGFPTPAVLAMCDSNNITWCDTQKTEPIENLLLRDMDVFVKDILGECSEGVFPLKIKNGQVNQDGLESTLGELLEKIQGRCIVQQRISQHEKMASLFPGSVNTIRLVTILQGNRARPLAAILRMGAGGSCDNLTTGGVATGVDLETGQLTKHGVLRPDFGTIAFEHPVTGMKFEGFEIPFFKEAVNQSCKLHRFFYGVQCIGWDIAITETGPVFIEGNDNWEVPTFQFFDSQFKQKFINSIHSVTTDSSPGTINEL